MERENAVPGAKFSPSLRGAGEGAGGRGPVAAGSTRPKVHEPQFNLPQGFLGEVRAWASGGGAARTPPPRPYRRSPRLPARFAGGGGRGVGRGVGDAVASPSWR
jgi:hypothetical protein